MFEKKFYGHQKPKWSSSPEDFINAWIMEPGTLDRIRKDSRPKTSRGGSGHRGSYIYIYININIDMITILYIFINTAFTYTYV